MAIIQGYPVGVSVAVVPGGPAATTLGPAPGLHTTDQIISVRHVSGDGSLAVNADVAAEVSVVDYQGIQLTTTDTTGNVLIVVHQEVH